MAEESAQFFAVAAEFGTGGDLLAATAAVRRHGLGSLHAYSPLPVPGLSDMLGESGGTVRIAGIAGAIAGTAGFFGMQVYATTFDYVFLVGGRPFLSWPYFVIPSVSIGALAGAMAAAIAMLFLSRLPRLNHPAFNIDGFERASSDRFFLTIEPNQGEDFDAEAIERVLLHEGPRPIRVSQVPR